jgi:hypothetical protein
MKISAAEGTKPGAVGLEGLGDADYECRARDQI